MVRATVNPLSYSHEVGGRRPVLALSVSALLWTACTTATPSIHVPSAPRECHLGPIRERIVPANELPDRIGWHLPRWLPKGFGLAYAFQVRGGGETGGGVWTDNRCREVEVRITSHESGSPQGERIEDWWIEYDAPGECGNPELGRARCLGYAARVDEGRLRVRMLGIDRPEGDRIVLSIPT
jgi:hypothetical protein